MNSLSKILLSVFLLKCFLFSSIAGTQAYSADHLILQDLDIENNLATICQDDGSLCSDVEVVSFDDLNRDQKDQVVEMIASSTMDEYSYNSTLELDQFSNFLSHSDEISYSSDPYFYFVEKGRAIALISFTGLLPTLVLGELFPQKRIFDLMTNGLFFVTIIGGSIALIASVFNCLYP